MKARLEGVRIGEVMQPTQPNQPIKENSATGLANPNQIPNWIHPAFVALEIYKDLNFQLTGPTQETVNNVIEHWKLADQSREHPRELLEHFGRGLAKYITLPEELKSGISDYVFNALGEAASIANRNKIEVTFEASGPIFSCKTVSPACVATSPIIFLADEVAKLFNAAAGENPAGSAIQPETPTGPARVRLPGDIRPQELPPSTPEEFVKALGVDLADLKRDPEAAPSILKAALEKAAIQLRVVDNDGQAVPVLYKYEYTPPTFKAPADVVRAVVLDVVQRQIEAGDLSEAARTLIETKLVREPEEVRNLGNFVIDSHSSRYPDDLFKPLNETEKAKLIELWQSKLPEFMGDLLHQVDGSESLGSRFLREVKFHEGDAPVSFSGKTVSGSTSPGYPRQEVPVDGIGRIGEVNQRSQRNLLTPGVVGKGQSAFLIAVGALGPATKDGRAEAGIQKDEAHLLQHQPLRKLQEAINTPFGPTIGQFNIALVQLHRAALERGAQPSVVDRYFESLYLEDSPRLEGEERKEALNRGLKATMAVADMGNHYGSKIRMSDLLKRLYEYWVEGVIGVQEFIQDARQAVAELGASGSSKDDILKRFPFLKSLAEYLPEEFNRADNEAAESLLKKLGQGQFSDVRWGELNGFVERGLIHPYRRGLALAEGAVCKAKYGEWVEFDKMIKVALPGKVEEITGRALEGRREELLSSENKVGPYMPKYNLPKGRDAAAFPDGFPKDSQEAEKLLTLINFGLQRAGEDNRKEAIAFISELAKTADDMRWVKLLPAHPIITCFGVDIVAEALNDGDAQAWHMSTGKFIKEIASHLDAELEPNKYQRTGDELIELVNSFERMLATGYVAWDNKGQFEKIASVIGLDNKDWFLGLNPEDKIDAFQQASTRVAIRDEIESASRSCRVDSSGYLTNYDLKRAVNLLTNAAIAAHRQYLESDREAGSEQAVRQRFDFTPLPENMPNFRQISDALKNMAFEGLEKAEAAAIVQFSEQSGIKGWNVCTYGVFACNKWTVEYNGDNFSQDEKALRQELGLLLEGKIPL